MTVPSERTNAVNFTGDFLCDLIDPKKTPGVPKSIRERASHLLRHYPSKYDMEMIAEREDSSGDNHPLTYKVFGTSWV